MASKAALRAVKASIDQSDFAGAAEKAAALVKQDPKNYTALIFLGFTDEKLDRNDKAEKSYRQAVNLKPSDPQALKGLINLYEKQGEQKLDQYHAVAQQLSEFYASQEDPTQAQSVVDKYEICARKYGSQPQYRHALELLLPSSSLYSALEGRFPHPSHTYLRILESAEVEEKDWINNQIGERRTRLGAKIDQVTQQVQLEAIAKFQVEEKYSDLINWTSDDDARHVLEEKLLRRTFDNLVALPADAKPAQRDKVLNLANGMVIIKHPFEFAWKIALGWVDADSLQEWDVGILREYIDYFPEEGLSKVLKGFLDSDISPFPPGEQSPESDTDDSARRESYSEADRLILMVEGIEDCPDSLLANRIMGEVYLSLDEFQSAAEAARKAQSLYKNAMAKYAADVQNSLDAVSLTLANALISYQSPRYHPESQSLFADILNRKPKLTAALLGVGLILEKDEDYAEAVKFLQQASERDAENLRIAVELAWCRTLDGDLKHGLEEFKRILSLLKEQKNPNLRMKAETFYRIGYCKWHLEPSAPARKNKDGAYKYLIDSIKADSGYAPAYTLLGIYFQDYGKSKQRARVALQKAFELSSSEIIAAQRLAKVFADASEWDLVELVAQRVVDSGKARPAPGSKKKAFSWPYAALGVVQMNKQQYAQSIVSFQSALRISPDDYHSWVGLGESYHSSGRYIAATRALTKAESLHDNLSADQTWFAKYMLANVQREMGSFDEAISGYENVLTIKKEELGVLVALLQTLTESAWAKIQVGMFGEASNLAVKAFQVASEISSSQTDVFNLWKAVGDACSVLASAQVQARGVNTGLVIHLLETNITQEDFEILADIDKVEWKSLEKDLDCTCSADFCLTAAILAHKRAVHVSAVDHHAQAVSWYNLGWAEHQAYVSGSPALIQSGKKSLRFLKASMRCFKRAIELEAGNSEFWNALGVVTMTMSPKVSQHAFVRSLHLNEYSARTWTNLGALYMIQNDNALANEAFTKAQSADPEYAHAWIGQGLLATLFGNRKEARGLFIHAFDIASSSSVPAKQQYAISAFDHLLKDPSNSNQAWNLLVPLFALHQLYSQTPSDLVFLHLSGLFAERIGNADEAVATFEELCASLQAKPGQQDSKEHLIRFTQAKCDLARSYLAQQNYDAAIKNAGQALQFSVKDDLDPAHATVRRKWRLSAHITVGLACYQRNAFEKSIEMFRAALTEAKDSPEVVCMLAQVLWAKGGEEERDAAREQLFACVERYPDNVEAVTLLAVIGLLDDDEDVLEAVEDDLKEMRVGARFSVQDKMKVTKVLSGVIACKSSQGPEDELASLADATKGVMLAPGQPQGWSELAEATNDPFPAAMALQNAARQVPPGGTLEAEDLAAAYANTRKRKDALQAIVLAPWKVEGYLSLADSL